MYLERIIGSERVVIISKTTCAYSGLVKQKFERLGAPYKAIEINLISDCRDIMRALEEICGYDYTPSVFIDGVHVGGFCELSALEEEGKLLPMLRGD
jgi:glutaredoxin 3